MKNILLLSSFFLATIFISSCKKDKDIVPTPPATPAPITYDNYSKLAVGNYWIYQKYTIDSLGNILATYGTDSCYVEKDTIINAQTYYKVFRPDPIFFQDYTFERDSLSYIVTSTGKIIFSSTDFTTVFSLNYYINPPIDTVSKVEIKMADKDMIVNAPLGIFTTSNYKIAYDIHPPHNVAGRYRNVNTRYAKDIGIVIERLPFFASSPNYTERRLLRYHVN